MDLQGSVKLEDGTEIGSLCEPPRIVLKETALRSVSEVMNERAKIAEVFPTSDDEFVVFWGEDSAPNCLFEPELMDSENYLAQMRISIHNLVMAEEVLADIGKEET